jgi:hypothetical protein
MNSKSLGQLRARVEAAIEESRVIVGHDHFYRTQTMREVLEWLDEMGTPAAASTDESNRLLCGTGRSITDGRSYEVVRRVRAKEYRVEFEDGEWKKVSLSEALDWVDVPNLGVEGLSAFDRAWHAKQEPLAS